MAFHLKSSQISIAICLLLCKSVASDTFKIGSCLTSYNQTINNQTGLIDDPYGTNLQSLFANFTTSSLSFYNTTAGEPPNKVYGLYLCRGDASSDTCHTCITDLTSWLIVGQTKCKEGAGYMDDCMLRYANYSFFGIPDDRVNGAVAGKYTNETLSREYNQTLVSVLDQVVNDAAYVSATSFATAEARVSGADEKVYGLAQCTPDISEGNCSVCLKVASDYLQHNLTKRGVAKSAWALLPSCQLRYDNVSSFDDSPTASMASPTVSAFLGAAWSFFFFFSLYLLF